MKTLSNCLILIILTLISSLPFQGYSQPNTSYTLSVLNFSSNKDAMLMGWSGFFRKTNDAGYTWNAGFIPVIGDIRHMARTQNGTYFVISSNGECLKSIDGQNWTNTPTGTNEFLNNVSFPSNNVGYISGLNGTLLKTTNAGQSWIQLPAPGSGHFYACNFINDTCGFIGGQGYLFYTNDGGQIWDEVITESDQVNFNSVYFLDSYNFWTIASHGKAYRTDDGGISWNIVDVPSWEHLYSINFNGPKLGFIGGKFGTFLISTDGGDTWNNAGVDNLNQRWVGGFTFTTGLTGYAWGENGLFLYTVDSGYTWSDIPPPALSSDLLPAQNYSIKIYPNPVTFNSTLTLDLSESIDYQVDIYSISGQRVYNGFITGSQGKMSSTIDMSSLGNGTYYLRLSGPAQKNYYFRIIKI